MAYREDGHNPAVIFCLQAKFDAIPLRNGNLEVFGQGCPRQHYRTDNAYILGSVVICMDSYISVEQAI